MADAASRIGPPPVAQSYLDIDRIVAACRATGAEAVHPGYGFLSENAAFAERLARRGHSLHRSAPRASARVRPEAHARAKPPRRAAFRCCRAARCSRTSTAAAREAERIGYPVMIKSTAGGGGIGLQRCHAPEQLAPLFESVQRLSRSNFKDGGVYVEKYVERARHVEVQIFGDGRGGVLALGERDCSLQRRNQKVVEETPAPRLPAATRAAMHAAAVRLGQHVAYRSAGTVEFIYDDDGDAFYFLEVNTRLQVEHGVTEAVTGMDLVEWMVRQAAGELAPLAEIAPSPRGAAIQVRLYAEDPGKNFLPACRPADARRVSRRCARRRLGRDRHRDHAALRSDAGEDHRARRRPRRRAGAPARRARRDRGVGRRDQPRLPRGDRRLRALRVRSGQHRRARLASPSRPRRSTCSRRAHRAVCRTGPAASASGTSACRRAGRWIRSRTASPTASSATPRMPRRSR